MIEKQGILDATVAMLAGLEVKDVARTPAPSAEIEWHRRIELELASGTWLEYEVFRTAAADWLKVGMESPCGENPGCARMRQRVDGLSPWLFEVPIATGSNLELAYVLTE